jgi:cytochrome d ubiquinol oxidase subunit I
VTSVSAGNIALTLALYLLLYAVLITSYITVVFYLARQAGEADSKSSEPTAHGPRVLAGNTATEGGRA